MEKNQLDKMASDGLGESKYGVKQLLAAVYVIIILGVFPLIYHDYYFDIMSFKYTFYYITTLIFIILFLIISIAQGNIKWRLLFDFSKKKMRLSIPEVSLLAFALIAIISTVQSDFKYEAFWGNEGRYTGCFLLLLYCISLILVSKSFKMKRWILTLFLLSGMLVCLFGITDFFKMDILNFKVKMEPGQYDIFASTIGNVNSYTSYVALVMAISAVMFSSEKIFWKAFLYYICMIVSFFAILMGVSDNAYLALGTLFGFLPLYLFKSRFGVRRYVLILTSFTGVIYGMDIINKLFADKVMKIDGILQTLLGFSKLEYIVLLMVILSGLVYTIGYFTRNKNDELGHIWQIIWLVFVLSIIAAVVFALYDVNVSKHVERYGGLSAYLQFSDDWGTHRGYNWRIGVENYSRLSAIHKIFGYGPDTYGILTHFNNYTDMVMKYGEVYDSAHNEYLQYFITMGPLSLLSYMVFIISSGVRMVKRSKGDICVIAVLFAVVCYAVQAVVNISVPIVAPIMFILLAIGLAGTRDI
ncbi:MAG: O-antigen ligase family protein [Hungatella sp.]|jgi:hypothetical protein|nr:O-antigen ligase family protein [Hungatella sp.]